MDDRQAPRSGRIVAELRRRIESGELAPGERLPSTREITRRWGVAMATATRVLAELRREGLVRAVPGVGTLVGATADRPDGGDAEPTGAVPTAPRAARPRPAAVHRQTAAEQVLTAERIVAAAIEVADTEGLAAVSMRRVAVELGAATMSLYRHVADKDDLVARMTEAVFAETPPPPDVDGWRERIELALRDMWAMFRRHPWLAPALSVSRPRLMPSAAPFTEYVLAALQGLGLDQATVFTIYLTLVNHVRGTAVNVEPEVEAEELTGLTADEWMDTQQAGLEAMLADGRFPTFRRFAMTSYDFDLDTLFEFGLQRLLDGIAALIDGAA